jgi:hypothetical protein
VAGAEVELLKLQASLVRAQSTVSVNSNVPEDTTAPSTEKKKPSSGSPECEWLLRVTLASKTEILELGVESRENALNWAKAIR